MPWLKLDDQFCDHPKIIEAGPLAGWLHVCGMLYCARLLTDGFIPAGQVRKLADVDNAGALADTLVEVGLWDRVDGGFQVHDYLEYNPSREKVLAERDANKQRQERYRERHSDRTNTVTNAVTDTVSNTRPVPVPTPVPISPTQDSEKPKGNATVAVAPSRPVRPPDEIFEALCEVCYGKPHDQITKSERGKLNTARNDLRSTPDATPDEVRRRGLHYAVMWPDLDAPSPTALSGNWTKIGNDLAKRNGANTHAITQRRDEELWAAFAAEGIIDAPEDGRAGIPAGPQRVPDMPRRGEPDRRVSGVQGNRSGVSNVPRRSSAAS